jgi:large subunit ribosomal protein L21
MYAVIKTGGKQYAVERGDRLFIEKLDVEPGEKVEFDRVLYLNADDSVQVGTPYLDAVRVLATAVENGKAKKVVTFKYKAKKDYRKKRGHRQQYTLVEIDAITAEGKILGGEIAPKAEKQAIPDEKPETAEKTEAAEDGAAAVTEAPEAADKAEVSAAKPKRAAKPKAEKPAAAADKAEVSAEKPKRAAKPKAEKPETAADKAEVSAAKPKRTAKPKADSAATPAAEKPAAKRAAKPKPETIENADAAPAAPEEEK